MVTDRSVSWLNQCQHLVLIYCATILQGITMRGKFEKGTRDLSVLLLTTAWESQNKKCNLKSGDYGVAGDK